MNDATHETCIALGCRAAHADGDECLDWQCANRYPCWDCGKRGGQIAMLGGERVCRACWDTRLGVQSD